MHAARTDSYVDVNIIFAYLLYVAEGGFEREKILHFLEHNKFPLVTKLTEMNSIRVYSSPVKRQVPHISHISLNCILSCTSLHSLHSEFVSFFLGFS